MCCNDCCRTTAMFGFQRQVAWMLMSSAISRSTGVRSGIADDIGRPTRETGHGKRATCPVSRFSFPGLYWARFVLERNILSGGGMGQGIQQPTVVQASGGSAWFDVVKVLYEPTQVFERVRERPNFLAPFIAICVVQIAVFVVNMPFLRAAMAAQFAARPAGGPDPSKFLWIGAVFIPVGIGLILVIAGGLLWVLVSIFGGEAKFGTLMGVSALAAIPSTLPLTIVSTLVLTLHTNVQLIF